MGQPEHAAFFWLSLGQPKMMAIVGLELGQPKLVLYRLLRMNMNFSLSYLLNKLIYGDIIYKITFLDSLFIVLN